MRGDVLCGQINLQKSMGSSTQLLSYLTTGLHTGPQNPFELSQRSGVQDRTGARTNSFLVFLQEPATMPNRVVGLGSGNKIFYDKLCDRTRTAIFASRNLDVWPVQEFTTKDVTTGIWINDGREIYVTSAYFDITLDRVIPETLERLMDHCEQRGHEVMICADTNAHSSLWNSPFLKSNLLNTIGSAPSSPIMNSNLPSLLGPADPISNKSVLPELPLSLKLPLGVVKNIGL